MIRKILKLSLLSIFSLYLHNYLFSNLILTDLATIIKVSLTLTIFRIFIKPILKILLLPINLLTLGLFRLVIDTLGLYISTYFIDTFKVMNINLQNINLQGITFPNTSFNGFYAYLITSFSLAVIIYLFALILYKKPQI